MHKFLFQNFAVDGLRTLCLGTRDLTEQEFSDWKASHHNAAISLENREEKLDAVYNQIERNLDLLGATAIEDKLQVCKDKIRLGRKTCEITEIKKKCLIAQMESRL